jgi:hypothetical protein
VLAYSAVAEDLAARFQELLPPSLPLLTLLLAFLMFLMSLLLLSTLLLLMFVLMSGLFLLLSPNSGRDFIMPCAVVSSIKTHLQIFL